MMKAAECHAVFCGQRQFDTCIDTGQMMSLNAFGTSANNALATIAASHSLRPGTNEVLAEGVAHMALFKAKVAAPHTIGAASVGITLGANKFCPVAATGSYAANPDHIAQCLAPDSRRVAAGADRSQFRAAASRLAVSRFGKSCDLQSADGAPNEVFVCAFPLSASLAESVSESCDIARFDNALLAAHRALAKQAAIGVGRKHGRRHNDRRALLARHTKKRGIVAHCFPVDGHTDESGQDSDAWQVCVKKIHPSIITHGGCDCTVGAG